MNDHVQTLLRSPFWKPNVGHVVIVATILIGWGRMSERFDALILKQGDDERKMERMDVGGTNFSANKLIVEQSLLLDHTDRIKKIEEAVVNIAVMKEKIERISEDVHELKSKKQ